MIEDHLLNIEKEIAAIRRELDPDPPSTVVRVGTQTELQNTIDNCSPGTTILVKPGIYDFIILRNGKRDIQLAPDATLGSGRVAPEWTDTLIKVKAFRCEPQAEGYLLTGFEFLPTSKDISILTLGSDKNLDPFNSPHDIVFNQCLVNANKDVGGKRGIQLMCRHVEIHNCHIAGFWYSSDSQAIGCYNGPGPYLIHNNYLEASGENFMSGGADSLNESMQPSYIEFTNNYCFKPEAWKTLTNCTVKNLFELKDCKQAKIQNNLFEGSWKDGQVGYAIVFTPRNQNGREPFTIVSNIDFSWNVVRNVGAGFNIMGDDNLNPSLRTENISIENNLIYDVDPVKHVGSAGRIFFISRSPKSVSIKNNTCLGIPKINSFMTIEHKPESLFVNTNIFTEGSYGLNCSPAGIGILGFNAQCVTSEFAANVIIPSNVRKIEYGPANSKNPNAVDPDTFRSLVPAGVNIDMLRSRVDF